MRPCHLLALALALSACGTGEHIRVRDRSGLIYTARARWQREVAGNERRAIAFGTEVGGWQSSGDYASPTGFKDHAVAVGYLGGTTDLRLRRFHVLWRGGVGYGDFEAEGQNRTLRDNGLGLMFGAEGRFEAASDVDLIARGTVFRRSSLTASLFEFGVAWQPTRLVGFELSYGIADNVIRENELFPVDDGADVRTQGLLLGLTLSF